MLRISDHAIDRYITRSPGAGVFRQQALEDLTELWEWGRPAKAKERRTIAAGGVVRISGAWILLAHVADVSGDMVVTTCFPVDRRRHR